MNRYSYAYNDQVGEDLIPIIGGIPKRWGRMNPMSRVLIVEVGRMLRRQNIIGQGDRCSTLGVAAGLIGATKRGCLKTDYDFLDSIDDTSGLASPALFGYTLPNIPLAEAAGQYGLTGPVYALFETEDPFEKAVQEAQTLLQYHSELSLMLACEFDHFETPAANDTLLLNLKIVE